MMLDTRVLPIRLRVGFRNETIFTTFLLSFWGERPDPTLDRLIVHVGINQLAASNTQVVRSLRFIIVKHHELSSVEPRVVMDVRKQLLGGFKWDLLQLALLIVHAVVVDRGHKIDVVAWRIQLSIVAE